MVIPNSARKQIRPVYIILVADILVHSDAVIEFPWLAY